MKYIGLILLLIGAFIAYPAKKIAAALKKEDENFVIKLKAAGLFLVVIGAVLTVTSI